MSGILGKEIFERLTEDEEERHAKAKADRLAKEEAERLAKGEAERLAKEETERLAKGEAERLVKEKSDCLAKEEAERLANRKEELEKLEAEKKLKGQEEKKQLETKPEEKKPLFGFTAQPSFTKTEVLPKSNTFGLQQQTPTFQKQPESEQPKDISDFGFKAIPTGTTGISTGTTERPSIAHQRLQYYLKNSTNSVSFVPFLNVKFEHETISTSNGIASSGTGLGTTRSSGFGTKTGTTGFGNRPSTTGFGTTASNRGFGTQTNTGFGQSNTGFGGQTNTGFGTQTNTGFGTQNTGFGTQNKTEFGTQTNTGFGQSNTGFGGQTNTGFGTQTNTGFGGQTNTSTGGTGFGTIPSTIGTTGFGSMGRFGLGTTSGGFGFGTKTEGTGLGVPCKPIQRTEDIGFGSLFNMSVTNTLNSQETDISQSSRPSSLTELLQWCKNTIKERSIPVAVFLSSSSGPLNHAEALKITTEPLNTNDFNITSVDYGTDTMVVRMEVSPNELNMLLELPATFSCKGVILKRRTFLSSLFKVTVNGLTRNQVENEEVIRHLHHILDHEQTPYLIARPRVAIMNLTGTQLIMVFINKPKAFQGRRSLIGQLDCQRVKATLESHVVPRVSVRQPTYADIDT